MKNSDYLTTDMLFTTGQMAKLCGITKDTLFYYDRIDLLKPAVVKDNGYRFYTINQAYAYDTIATLISLGFSLDEIQVYNLARSPQNFIDMLEKNMELLSVSIQRLTWKLEMMENTTRHLREVQKAPLNMPFFSTLPQRHYLLTPSVGNTPFQKVKNVFNHHLARKDNTACLYLLFSGLTAEADYLAGNYDISHICSQVRTPWETSDYCSLPAGQYALMYYHGDEVNSHSGIDRLMAFIREQGKRPVGPMISGDIVNEIANVSEENYIIELSVRVQ